MNDQPCGGEHPVRSPTGPLPAPSPRVLVVEHDADRRVLLELVFAELAFDVRPVAGAEAAWPALADWRPDLIVLDLGLPHANAWALCSAFRHHPDTRGVPVVVVAPPDHDDGTLPAPLTLAWLLEKLERHCPTLMRTPVPGSTRPS